MPPSTSAKDGRRYGAATGTIARNAPFSYGFRMTQLLERAFNEVSKLTEREQDAIAAIMLEQLDCEQRQDWSVLSKSGLARACSDDEPGYPASLVRKPNTH